MKNLKNIACLEEIWLRFGIGIFAATLLLFSRQAPVGAVVLNQGEGTREAKIEDHMPGEVLVKFKKTVTPSEKRQYHSEVNAEVLAEIPAIGVERVKSKNGESTEVLLNKYKKNPFVEYVEPNGLFHAQLTPNDPRFPELYGLHNTGQSSGIADADIDAPEAWDIQTGSSSVIVAGIDSGVDYNHPDLAENIWSNPGEIPGNGIDDDGNGFIDDIRGWNFVSDNNNPFDDFGHGTHTAGTIAAVGNNGIGVVGVSWHTKIMPLKFLDSTGSGSFANAASAIIYAANKGARISNNSYGCTGSGCYSQVVDDAIAYANSKGMLFVVSAGNSNNNNDATMTYPCTSTQPNVLCVAATDRNDQKARFSNYGAASVNLGAPGVSILSTVPTGSCPFCDPTGYRLLDGTSQATSHVAGAAALVLAQSPSLTIAQLTSAILNNVDPVAALAAITVTGGRLNLDQAIGSNSGNKLSAASTGPDLIMTAVSGPANGQMGGSITISDTVKNQGVGQAGYFCVGLLLSTDATITTSDTILGFRCVNGLAGVASSSGSTTFIIPNLTPGTYYIGAIADANGNQVPEDNENNNSKTGNTITITP